MALPSSNPALRTPVALVLREISPARFFALPFLDQFHDRVSAFPDSLINPIVMLAYVIFLPRMMFLEKVKTPQMFPSSSSKYAQ